MAQSRCVHGDVGDGRVEPAVRYSRASAFGGAPARYGRGAASAGAEALLHGRGAGRLGQAAGVVTGLAVLPVAGRTSEAITRTIRSSPEAEAAAAPAADGGVSTLAESASERVTPLRHALRARHLPLQGRILQP
ncbi:Cellulose synthase operon protein C [Novosphingobium sp. 9U]|nr:Cellulose synthase operon protein C [Novosphingobium sp. 9U]